MKKDITYYKIIIVSLTVLLVTISIYSFKPNRDYIPTLYNSATLNFASTGPGASSDLTVSLTGAVSGDIVAIGVPNGSTLSNGLFTAWVSASNTVTVRFSNNDLFSSLDPASGVFKVFIFKQ